MTSLLPSPELTFFDNDGNPLALGTVETYIPSTSTHKSTYATADSSVVNANPTTLDAAGRGIFYGAGGYRFVVKDALGNLTFDQVTSSYLSEDVISPFMLAVVGSATSDTFLTLSGTRAFVNAAVGAVSLLAGPTGPTGPSGGTGPTGPAGSAGSGYTPSFVGGNPAYASFPNLNGTAANLLIQGGTGATDSGGNATVSFPRTFPTSAITVVAQQTDTATGSWFCSVLTFNSSSFSVRTSSPLVGGSWAGGPVGFNWIALGY